MKELARLISRLRHRQFGILVTTSFLGHQAYQELRSDRHPVVVIAGADIAAILVKAGLGTPEAVGERCVRVASDLCGGRLLGEPQPAGAGA